MKIAWIGLGTMGEFMAGHLLDAGHELSVHNRTREREEGLAARGARRGPHRRGRPPRAPSSCVLCVSDSPDVEAVVLGPGGIAEGIAAGAVVLDCSTIAPDTTRRVAAALAERGAGAVDAPVSAARRGRARAS